MDPKIEMLKEGIESLYRKYQSCVEKMRDGGKLSTEDMQYFDQLTHSMKSLETIVAMKEASESGGYSQKRDAMGRYARDGGMNGGSYRMDSRGSYGGYAYDGGYSGNDRNGVAGEVRNMVGELDEAKLRQVQRFIQDMHEQGGQSMRMGR